MEVTHAIARTVRGPLRIPRMFAALTVLLCITMMLGGVASAAAAKPNRNYQKAANFANSQVGKAGYDCSLLTQRSVGSRREHPRTAQSQYNAVPHIWVSYGHLLTGDLVFIGSGPGHVTHVVIYYGAGYSICWSSSRARVYKYPNFGTGFTPTSVAKYFGFAWADGGRPGGHWYTPLHRAAPGTTRSRAQSRLDLTEYPNLGVEPRGPREAESS